MQCQQIMKRNVRAVADVFLAARIMGDNDIGFLPVCDEAGRVIGVLTDRDLAVRICAEDLRATTTPVASVPFVRVIAPARGAHRPRSPGWRTPFR